MTFRAVIVGAGISGICAGIRLREAGYDVVILEKASSIGGTWRDNVYPGAACDVPSHLYSFSFFPKSDWSRTYASQDEILRYLETCVEKHDLGRSIRFSSEVIGAKYDEEKKCWSVELADGRTEQANFLIWACGQLHRPNIPKFEGFEEFQGEIMHSAQWQRDTSLEGSTVALVGNAASGIQIAGAIADQVGRLIILQRTPNWIMPRVGGRYRDFQKRLFGWVPPFRWLRRYSQFWQQEALIFAFRRNSLASRALTLLAQKFMRRKIGNEQMFDTLTPDYPIGCKRILLSNSYLKLFQRDNVVLETGGIDGFSANGICLAGGRKLDTDVVVLATGFRATEMLTHIPIAGTGGRMLQDEWADGAYAHLGLTVPGFPNMFILYGPNTGLGHNSMIFMIECQVNHVRKLAKLMNGRGLRSVEARQSACDQSNRKLQERALNTAWAGACTSWYKTENGRLTGIWPYSAVRYWLRTRWPLEREYRFD
ncbi:MAG: flavin-containing monooxygenase [Rhizobiaceae bacterium]